MHKIIYCYDALCGWCYGFSPVMEKIHQQYQQDFQFEVISGGMITGERIGPVGEVAPYIKQAYKLVENTTGVKFGDDFLRVLNEGKAIFTSIPPAIALSILKEEKPEMAVPFAGALQRMIYFDGKAPDDFDAYADLAEKFRFNRQEFLEKMQDDEYHQLAEKDFQLTARLGVRGFPMVIAEMDQQYYALANGYATLEDMQERIEQVMTRVNE